MFNEQFTERSGESSGFSVDRLPRSGLAVVVLVCVICLSLLVETILWLRLVDRVSEDLVDRILVLNRIKIAFSYGFVRCARVERRIYWWNRGWIERRGQTAGCTVRVSYLVADATDPRPTSSDCAFFRYNGFRFPNFAEIKAFQAVFRNFLPCAFFISQ